MLVADITNQYGGSLTEPASSFSIHLNTAFMQLSPVSHGQLRRQLISTFKMVDLLLLACGHAKEAKINMHKESFHKYQ